MRQLFLLSVILFLIFSCGFNKQNETLDLSFSVDVNKLKEIVSSQSEASALDSNIKKNISSMTTVTVDDELFFFGIVLREVDGAIKDADGRAVGKIIPGASRIINGFKDAEALKTLMDTGTIKMTVDVPSPSNIAITVFAVFIGEDEFRHSPETWTSLFHVAGPFKIEGGEASVNIAVSGEQMEDDHAPFVDWYGIFADSSGNPISGANLKVKHCKIGFTFEQSMFDNNLEDRFLFRTDTKGRISSLMPGSGVDWEISIGSKIIRACGSSGFNNANYPSGTPEIMFTAFVGDTLYENPYDFANDVNITPIDFGIVNIGTGPSDWLADHDGDGVKTSIEITELKSNPFNDNEIIHNDFDGDLAYVEEVKKDGTSVRLKYSINKNKTGSSGSCAMGEIRRFNGTSWETLGAPWEETSGSDYSNCVYDIGESDLYTWVPTGEIKNIVLQIHTGFDADFDGDTVFTDPITLYKSFKWCNGTSACSLTPSLSFINLEKRYWGDGPSDRIEPVTNFSTLVASGCNSDFNYLLTMSGSGFKSGGVGYLSSTPDCANLDMSTYFHGRVVFDDKFQFEMNRGENTNAGPFYFCYKEAVNSTSHATIAFPKFSFIENPDYSCDDGTGGNAFSYFSVGSISEGDLASQVGPNISAELYSSLGTDSNSVRLWFNSTGYNMCLSFYTYGYDYYINPSSTYVVNESLPTGMGSYNVDSIEFYSDSTCSSGLIDAFDVASFNQTLEVTSTSLVSNISSASGGPFNVSTSTYNAPDINFSLNSGLTEDIQSVHLSMDAGSKNLCVDIYLSYGMTSFNLSSGGTINSTNMINDGSSYLLESIHFYPGTGCVTESFSENVSGLNFLFQTALNPSVTNLYSSSGGPYDITPSNSGPDIEVSLSTSGLIEDTQSIFLSMDYGAKSMCVNVYLTSGTTLFNLNTGTIFSTDMISGTNYSLDEIYFYSGPDCSMTPTFTDDVNIYNFLFQTLI